MRKKLEWGKAFYDVLKGEEVVLGHKDGAACFSEFMSRFSLPYDTIRIYNIDCEPTVEYKEFYLQYVTDMLKLESSSTKEYFEFKSLGSRIKDAAVMSIVRFLWENMGSMTPHIDSSNRLFKRLRDDECPHEDKLERFCYFYKELADPKNSYFSDGHSWQPSQCKIRSTDQFVKEEKWSSVNGFFTKLIIEGDEEK